LEEVLKNFPFRDYRQYQKESIEKIVEHFNKGGRIVLLEAPTGFGKSAVDITLCKSMLWSFYITPQKMLQDQMEKEFGHSVAVVKGRGNYPCVELDDDSTCDKGPCKKRKKYSCEKKEECRYWLAKKNALFSQVALMNFRYFLVENLIPEGALYKFGNRELLVIDEGHDVDRHILDMISVTISDRTLPRELFMSPSIQTILEKKRKDLDDIILEVKVVCEKKVDILERYEELNNTEINYLERLKRFLYSCDVYMRDFENNEWIEQYDKVLIGKKSYLKLKLQPIYIHRFAERFLWSRAECFIVSSATIFQHSFIKENGIEQFFAPNEVLRLSYPSTFPLENRKIVEVSVGRLSRKQRETNIQNVTKAIDYILSRDDVKGKGLIHTHSYQNLEFLKEKYGNNGRFVFHDKKNRIDTLKEWLQSNPKDGKIFVAVAMTEGLDLIDELCRFQICFKCPFPDLSDARTHKRTIEYKDHNWYNTQALKTLIQMYGRAVRHDKDWALFFYLDESVNRLCKRYLLLMPKWFRQAWSKREIVDNSFLIPEIEVKI